MSNFKFPAFFSSPIFLVQSYAARRRWKSNPSNSDLSKFESIRVRFEKEVKNAKSKFYLDRFKSCIEDSKQTFRVLDEISGDNYKKSSIPLLEPCKSDQSYPSSATSKKVQCLLHFNRCRIKEGFAGSTNAKFSRFLTDNVSLCNHRK